LYLGAGGRGLGAGGRGPGAGGWGPGAGGWGPGAGGRGLGAEDWGLGGRGPRAGDKKTPLQSIRRGGRKRRTENYTERAWLMYALLNETFI
jgi:hypothetical protein